jgi:catechol 2,3-dioxygenase-like lactoylglutathione lyase family enzyme
MPARALLRAAYPQLFVTDIARAVEFYRKLGFVTVYLYGEPPFYGLISRDGAGLNLRHVDSPVIDRSREESLLSAGIPVDDVAALHAEFTAHGVELAQPLKVQPWGTTDFVVRDPDGNLLCFYEEAAAD